MPRPKKSRKNAVIRAKKMHLVLQSRKKSSELKDEDHNPTTYAEINVDSSIQMRPHDLSDCKPDLFIENRQEEDPLKSTSPQKTTEDQIQIETSSGPHHSRSDLSMKILTENDNISTAPQNATENSIQV